MSLDQNLEVERASQHKAQANTKKTKTFKYRIHVNISKIHEILKYLFGIHIM